MCFKFWFNVGHMRIVFLVVTLFNIFPLTWVFEKCLFTKQRKSLAKLVFADLLWIGLNQSTSNMVYFWYYEFLSLFSSVYFNFLLYLRWFFFQQYNRLQLDKTKNKWKIFYKEITKKETRKHSTSTDLTALSNRTVKKVGGGGHRRKKNEYTYLKLKKENNIKTMVLKFCL